MTEYMFIKSRMNAWDKYGQTWAFVLPVAAFFVLMAESMMLPERDVHLQNPILQITMLVFLIGLALLITSRIMWVNKQAALKDEFANEYTDSV